MLQMFLKMHVWFCRDMQQNEQMYYALVFKLIVNDTDII